LASVINCKKILQKKFLGEIFSYILFLILIHLDSPKRLWRIGTRRALNKPSLEYFRKHIDKKKDSERKKKYDVATVIEKKTIPCKNSPQILNIVTQSIQNGSK